MRYVYVIIIALSLFTFVTPAYSQDEPNNLGCMCIWYGDATSRALGRAICDTWAEDAGYVHGSLIPIGPCQATDTPMECLTEVGCYIPSKGEMGTCYREYGYWCKGFPPKK